ncbi:hypothetical protein [Listeria seeligeri]|uniref:hypothetical protein n=1 Tax=Listeria seeligeri TaxID=1640 RepID=UPI0010B5E60B|nr:hypothetical protein [Listeria seeligeri]EAC2922385.1 hypothetical protein [Listeria monocytogenes]MBC1557011.1 hypothetical protein [Listeria seeligeri]
MFWKKKPSQAYTQDLVGNIGILQNAIDDVERKTLIGGLHCPPINLSMMTKLELMDLRRNFSTAISNAGDAIQIKIIAEPVDLSDMIENEYNAMNQISDVVKQDLKRSYIQFLEERAVDQSTLQKERYFLLKENYRSDQDKVEKIEILKERLNQLIDDLMDITEDTYISTLLSGQKLVQILQIDLNYYEAKMNRFISQSPEFIVSGEEENLLEGLEDEE